MTQHWIFTDFDNTLMGTEAMAMPPLLRRFNELYGDKVSEPLTYELFSKHFQGMARETFCKAVGDYYGIYVDYQILFAKREEIVTSYFREQGVPMADNLIECFTALSSRNVRFAVVTNNMVQRCLGAMRFAANGQGEKLARFFGTHYFEAGNLQKPDPDVYLRAIDFSNADKNFSCAIEDSSTGARAALGAGLKTFGFIGYAEHPEAREKELLNLGVTACFKDWADFPALWLRHANR